MSASAPIGPAAGRRPWPLGNPRFGERARFLRQLAHLGRALPGFLRRPILPSHARQWAQDGLAARERRFLERLGRDVYGNPASPYLHLLRLSGCELGDLTRLVATQGIEGTLERLRDGGVYVTVDEFKGRRDVVRGERGFDSGRPTSTGRVRGRASRCKAAGAAAPEHPCRPPCRS